MFLMQWPLHLLSAIILARSGLLNPEKPKVPQSSTEAVSQRSHRSDYPVLSKMAFDILSIPSMSPELERAFSQAKKLNTGERNRLGGETVTACECQKQWQVIRLVGRRRSGTNKKKKNTYSSWDSLVVTHPTTNQPACSLSTTEQTGSPVFCTLWPYVEEEC